MGDDQPFTLRPMGKDDWSEVADLIHVSTNHWYVANGRPPIFSGDPRHTTLFCEVYEDLDPGCCLLAEHRETGRIMGSCFYHPRETHVSLGIMNVHPNYFGQGVAGALLRQIIALSEERGLPTRLVSSAVNLDSYSLYTRAGFTPVEAYQDMFLQVPEKGFAEAVPGSERVRAARLEDVPAMVALEEEATGIRRGGDFTYFIENRLGIWNTLVMEGETGGLDGFLASVRHPASNMIGPGVMKNDTAALALLRAQLAWNAGGCPVFLVPVRRGYLVRRLYGWGARNCEIHFSQVRGGARQPSGIVMPTFMPETA